MVNFGERIASWYLRLQGFLLTEDYVLHRGDEIDHTADTDIVGVRLRHSRERIGGSVLTPHSPLVAMLNASVKHAVVIAQVKTGESSDPGRAFEGPRLKYALRFVGAFPEEKLGAAVAKLETESVIHVEDDWVVAKVLFAKAPDPKYAVPVPLDHALGFIEAHLAKYSERKMADRLSFPDELMQFLAWRSGRLRPEER